MSLVRDMAHAFGYELRAAYNTNRVFNDHKIKHRPGLTTWSPTINVMQIQNHHPPAAACLVCFFLTSLLLGVHECCWECSVA